MNAAEPLGNPEQAEPVAAIVTVIPADCLIVGTIRSHGDMQVYGAIEGDITLTGGTLSIMANARVEGDILADGILINGLFKGHAHGDLLQIGPQGNVRGLVRSNRLVLEHGAILVGKSEYYEPAQTSNQAVESPASSVPVPAGPQHPVLPARPRARRHRLWIGLTIVFALLLLIGGLWQSARHAQVHKIDAMPTALIRTENKAPAPPPIPKPPPVDPVAWLESLAELQGKTLNAAVALSQRVRGKTIMNTLHHQIQQLSTQLMATREQIRQYAPDKILEPYNPTMTSATDVSIAKYQQQLKHYQVERQVLLTQADRPDFPAGLRQWALDALHQELNG